MNYKIKKILLIAKISVIDWKKNLRYRTWIFTDRIESLKPINENLIISIIVIKKIFLSREASI